MSWLDNIKEKVIRRIPDLAENNELCEDLIDDAFRSIVKYSQSDYYKVEWDNVLVRCVAMLYNNIGVEGSISRSSLSTSDIYSSTNVIDTYVQGTIQQSIRPLGHIFPDTRFNYPN